LAIQPQNVPKVKSAKEMGMGKRGHRSPGRRKRNAVIKQPKWLK
jgi:hypothetical protein